MNKIESLAIDALTQFRAGVDKVRIGPIEIKAVEAFELGRNSELYSSDEEALITAIKVLIISEINHLKSQLDNILDQSVEVVA
jgi:hypothetical protein